MQAPDTFQVRLECSNGDVVIDIDRAASPNGVDRFYELVKEGVGIGIMPEHIGDAEQKVVRVLPESEPFTVELWLVAHRELRTSRRIRRVFDFLAEELGSNDQY